MVLYFIIVSGNEIATYLVVIFGIFLCLTFSFTTYILIKNQLPYGIYASLAVVSLLLVVCPASHRGLQALGASLGSGMSLPS